MADQSKTDALRAMREANWVNRNRPKATPFEDAARGRDPVVSPKRGLRVASRPKGKKEIGDGVAFTSMVHPPGLIESMAEAIISGKLSLKKGRPRLGEKRDRPWLHTNPPMSRTTWYRRQKEKAVK